MAGSGLGWLRLRIVFLRVDVADGVWFKTGSKSYWFVYEADAAEVAAAAVTAKR